jgi:membrane protein DedA with SNARE-associated domain
MVFVAAAFEGDATLLSASSSRIGGTCGSGPYVMAAAAGTITINQVYFWLARKYGARRLAGLQGHRVYGRVLRWLDVYGVQLVVGSRFAYGFRIAIPAVFRRLRMSPVKFTLGDVCGSIVWACTIGLAGYAIGHVLSLLVDDLRAHEWWVAGLLLVGTLALLARHGRDWLAVRSSGRRGGTR